MSLSFLASEYPNVDADRARFHVLPVPLEQTASYGGGTANGPEAILAASQQLEAFDGISCPGEEGIFTLPALDCSGNTEGIVSRIHETTRNILTTQHIPVLLGGEHTVSVGAFRALAEMPDPVGIVHIDAHADLRDTYEDSPLSHACVIRRALDLELPVVQFGIRSLSLPEHQLRRDHNIAHIDAWPTGETKMHEAPLPANLPQQVYVTFDIDALDPSIVPATGTPEPGGIDWHTAMALLKMVASKRTIIGFDLVELAPRTGDHTSDFIAARLVYNLMGFITRSKK